MQVSNLLSGQHHVPVCILSKPLRGATWKHFECAAIALYVLCKSQFHAVGTTFFLQLVLFFLQLVCEYSKLLHINANNTIFNQALHRLAVLKNFSLSKYSEVKRHAPVFSTSGDGLSYTALVKCGQTARGSCCWGAPLISLALDQPHCSASLYVSG